MLSLRPSFTPYPITGLYIILVLLNSHFINGNRGWTRNETDASGDLKRNRRVASAQNHFKTNIAYCLFVLSAKRFSRNRISSKYLNHASAYSLQTICCCFINLQEENENTADTDNKSRLPG